MEGDLREMKKKIGFIDLFIDEWHSCHYPDWIRNSSCGDRFEVAYAYEKSPHPDRRPLGKWCSDMNIIPVETLAGIVEKSDCLCVLAPSNPEVHEELASLALESGKPTYVDKPFAPDAAVAKRMFEKAKMHGTPLMTTSALRFSDELIEYRAGFSDNGRPFLFTTKGSGANFPEYAIHQFEMIVSALGTEAKRLIVSGSDEHLSGIVEYPDHRLAQFTYAPHTNGFSFMGMNRNTFRAAPQCTHIFENLIEEMMRFFNTGISVIPEEESVEISALCHTAVIAMKMPGVWHEVER